MPRANLFWQATLGGPLLVASGNIRTAGPKDVVAASNQTIFVSIPRTGGYLLTDQININQPVLSLAIGFPVMGLEHIFVGTREKILVYGNRQGKIVQVTQTPTETGVEFTDLLVADLDGDGTTELIGATGEANSLLVYQLISPPGAEIRTELLAIRQLPGTPISLAVFNSTPQGPTLLVVAYRNNQNTGILTLFLTERGFGEGPAITNFTPQITGLAAADLLAEPGEELAVGGRDGAVRIVKANDRLNIRLTTNSLGSTISAITAGLLAQNGAQLVAGTPGSYVFGFPKPLQPSPHWAFRAIGPINDLALADERVVVGTTNGFLQVWEVK
ncbi:FG-GAP repeat-containing protein [Desulfotomaculum nigrificans CO-1-SRB]|uniref:FG-GAP repeat-containing protein n=1 Tax=Desulfotomaculum nigrificans (strain DSM 14880 / VKM B-2319 / CO-1-SRB) TaxID=868595 RepID=F6B424_DESCC|nr:VCBS repeat-containing protein [Desulfotomaculum nigrificans]AEF94079.1 FG-GAP repeat-containing protein [Desulfotomaculum nigrificans CO-1-SRB]